MTDQLALQNHNLAKFPPVSLKLKIERYQNVKYTSKVKNQSLTCVSLFLSSHFSGLGLGVPALSLGQSILSLLRSKVATWASACSHEAL